MQIMAKTLLCLYSLLLTGCSTTINHRSLIPVGEKIHISKSDALRDVNITVRKTNSNEFALSKHDLERVYEKCIQRKERIKELLLLINEHNDLLKAEKKTINTDKGN